MVNVGNCTISGGLYYEDLKMLVGVLHTFLWEVFVALCFSSLKSDQRFEDLFPFLCSHSFFLFLNTCCILVWFFQMQKYVENKGKYDKVDQLAAWKKSCSLECSEH